VDDDADGVGGRGVELARREVVARGVGAEELGEALGSFALREAAAQR
jgi:hypothetical protein